MNSASTAPVSILDRDSGQAFIVAPDENPDTILPLITLIIFIIFLGGMIYLLIASHFQSTTPQNPVKSDVRTQTTFTCPAGQCGTNLLTGVKTCPQLNVPITINPAESVCNSRLACDNPLTPFAVQSDGSTNINGVCESNSECACLSVSQCADYVLSAFTTSNGSAFQSVPGQRITFPQKTTFVNAGGTQTDTPPIQFNNPGTTFCTAPISWLPLSGPGCNFVSATSSNNFTLQDLQLCMGEVLGCSGLAGSPCLQGTLAALSSNPDTINAQTVLSAQFACVRGESCPCGQIAIFDTNFGGIVCKQLS